jgi:hypothetical protein
MRAADNVFEEPTSRSSLSVVDTPKPTARFRRRAWREFQRALDPLARPTTFFVLPAKRGRGPTDR